MPVILRKSGLYLTFVASLFVAGSDALAQNGYVPGYVILNSGDTLRGKIKDRKFVSGISSWQKVDFLDAQGKKYRFTPEDVAEYERSGRGHYKTLVIGIEVEKTFMQVLENGPVILYGRSVGPLGGAGNAVAIGTDKDKKTTEARNKFYSDVPFIPVYTTTDKDHIECFLQFKNTPASLMQWRPRDYVTTAKVFFKDEPEVLRLLENGDLDDRDVRSIVHMYNQKKK